MALVTRSWWALALALALSACGNTDGQRYLSEFRYAAEGDVLSLAFAASEDVLHVVWVEDLPGQGPAARHSASADGGASWTTPVTIDTGQPPPNRVHRSNDIRVAVAGETVYTVWQTRGDGWAGSGPMVMARSGDGGRHWEALTPPATPDDSPSHGFFALSIDPDALPHLAWLDSRHGQQGLLHARGNGAGGWSVSTVKEQTCECCWNSLLHAGDRTYLLFRGKNPRDMGLAEQQGNSDWNVPGRVGAFDWHVDGCPHVGGSLALDVPGHTLHALVWTAHEDHLGVHHLRRQADGGAWSAPRRIGSRDARNTDLASHPRHGLLAAWDQTGADAAVYAAWMEDDGPGSAGRLSPADQRASHPLVAVTSSGGHVAWTERGDDDRRTWRIRTLPLPK